MKPKQIAMAARAKLVTIGTSIGRAAQRLRAKVPNSVQGPFKSADGQGPRPAGSLDKTALEAYSRKELYQRAQELDIAGRSNMTKAQLVRAIRDRQEENLGNGSADRE